MIEKFAPVEEIEKTVPLPSGPQQQQALAPLGVAAAQYQQPTQYPQAAQYPQQTQYQQPAPYSPPAQYPQASQYQPTAR